MTYDNKKFGGFEIGDDKQGIDLSGSLKDSSTGMKFDERWRVEHSYYPETPKIIQWVIKYSGRLVKDERQASYVLIGFVVLVIIVSLFLVLGGGDTRPSISPKDLRLTPPSSGAPR